MKTKIFTLLLAVAASIGTMFAAIPEVSAPENGYVTIVISIPDSTECNGIYLKGTLDGSNWSGGNTYVGLNEANVPASDAIRFEPINNSKKWFKATFKLGEAGLMFKVCQLYQNDDSWQGQAELFTIDEDRSTITNYTLHGGQIEIPNNSAPGVLYLQIYKWQKSECDSTKKQRTITVTFPECGFEAPSIVGDFNDWDPYATPMTQVNGYTYTATIEANDLDCFKFASVTSGWDNTILVYDAEIDDWNNMDNIYFGGDTNIVLDLSTNTWTNGRDDCPTTFTWTIKFCVWGKTFRTLYLQAGETIVAPTPPNFPGYHFTGWDKEFTTATGDMTINAVYISDDEHACVYIFDSQKGAVEGPSFAEDSTSITITAIPKNGYHFTQWSDGLKDNPRIAQITQDTTFTAEFAYDRVGTCGKDLALVWSYDPNAKVLTIGNAGSFTENMKFGVEAPNEMEELVIGNSVTAIGANAFAGIETLKKVSIGESVKTIGEQAFFNCVNLETIFNYRPTPTNAYSTAFDGVDKFECKLYVLPSSIDMYKAAAVWRDFYYTYAIGAEEATVVTNDVQVEPQDNAATLTWPTSNNAASYTIEITKDGVLFCTLTFNSNGQLTGIAFAPSRDGQAHAPAAVMTANGLQFTVTGLDSGTQYGYNLTAKDANDQTVATYSGSFTTTSEGETTGVDNVPSDDVPCTKVIRNGQIYILRGEKVYSITGQEVR